MFRSFGEKAVTRLIFALGVRLERIRDTIGVAALPRFASPAPGLVIRPPYEIRHPERIRVGRDVKLGMNCLLRPIVVYPSPWVVHPDGEHHEQTFDPWIDIGDRVTATGGLMLTAFTRVTIEEDVMFGVNVTVADGDHASDRGDVPYKFQGIGNVAPVHIGRGSWIGNNSVIRPGVTVGAFAIVGANSVVTTDVPAGSVVAGTPARVIRRWDPAAERWVAAHGREPTTGDEVVG